MPPPLTHSLQLIDAGRLLQQCFSTALQGQGNKAKKLATLEVLLLAD